jgi:hypothetical protein
LYDGVVTQIVAEHAPAANTLPADQQLMKIFPITENRKNLAKLLSDQFKQESSLVDIAVQYFEAIIFAFTGDTPISNSDNDFPWLSDWYWYRSGFSLCAFLFLGATASFVVLCFRLTPERQRVAASYITPMFAGSLLSIAWAGFRFAEIILIAAGSAGVACCIWARLNDRVKVTHKIASLVCGWSMPFFAMSLVVYFLQGCFGGRSILKCVAFGKPFGDLRLSYIGGGIVAVIVLGELFLWSWRRIAVKPS